MECALSLETDMDFEQVHAVEPGEVSGATEIDDSVRRWWALEIASAWRKTAECLVETGEKLVAAKKALPRGQWKKLVDAELPFSYKIAQQLMKIAGDAKIRTHAKSGKLPMSVRTLWELTKLEPKEFRAAVKDGRINAGMTQFDAIGMVQKRDSRDVGEQYQRRQLGRSRYLEAANGGGGRLASHGTELSKAVGDCTYEELLALTKRAKIRARFYELLSAAVPPMQVCKQFVSEEQAEELWRRAVEGVS